MDDSTILPVRMVSEFAYCPRLFYFMHVEGRWADNAYTAQGREVHIRVDRYDDVLPDPLTSSSGEAEGDEQLEDGDPPPAISRSVKLESERLGLVAKLDLVSTAGDEAVPVETKRGRPPKNAERSWEPERVQLMAQGLLLRENGYRCDHGVLYFAASRSRVNVPFAADLEARTLHIIEQARVIARSRVLPDPLEDSPKCSGCSLNAICLPDETLALRDVPADPATTGDRPVRRLYPMRDDALPFYVQEQGASIGKTRGVIIVRKNGEEIGRARLKDISQVVICGNISITAQTTHMLCEAAVPIVHLSSGHWFYGITHGIALRNAYDRAAQFLAAARPERALALAKAIVAAKGANQRTLLGRNSTPAPEQAMANMARYIKQVPGAQALDSLLGIEGSIAAEYFSNFALMLRPRDMETEWDYGGRNRRPPRDPVNALLSFTYALLTKECTIALLSEGLDPYWGFYHQPRHGRPALALDLMEEFRALVADSAVLSAINTGMVSSSDFIRSSAGCVLKDSGRKGIIRAYEARLDQLITHPIFGYRCSWRAIIRLQARLLARWLRGDVPEYIGIRTR